MLVVPDSWCLCMRMDIGIYNKDYWLLRGNFLHLGKDFDLNKHFLPYYNSIHIHIHTSTATLCNNYHFDMNHFYKTLQEYHNWDLYTRKDKYIDSCMFL